MRVNLLDYRDYKKYVTAWLNQDSTPRGTKNRLAQFIQCQPSYLSQVLNGLPDFTLEQGFRANEFLAHTEIESRYFLLLIQLARAGTPGLKNHFQAQVEEVQKSRFHLKKRLSSTEDIPEKFKHEYYSTWIYGAVHVALSIPHFQNPKTIAERFHLPIQKVKDVIEFLETAGLVEIKKDTYVLTKNRIHLDGQSIFIQRHHINWRSQSLQSVEKAFEDDLHYSNVIAISKNDFPKIKEIFVTAIEEARKIIKPSAEEEIYAMTLDFFKL